MDSYTFPFATTDTIIELGGGNRPYFRPNLDVRSGENIDIVADFNEPLPLEDEQYDGVFSCYCIEHLSWRKVRLFLSEVLRILKPNGKAVFITANTERQMQHVLAHDEWNDDSSCILFGDQDYPENTHRNSLCPRYAIKLLTEMGFSNVIVIPTGAIATDMIIEAQKIAKESPKFDSNHFMDPNYYGPQTGYYRDTTANWVISNKVLELKPQSVLEIGCGRGYVLKRLESSGISCVGLDISKHCYLTRVTDSVSIYDICQTPWPFVDKQFDLCLSHGVLDLLPKEKLASVLAEINRATRRGLHSSDFISAKSIVPEQAIVPSKYFEEQSTVQHIPIGDGKLKLNIGCDIAMIHNGWVNTDPRNLEQIARQNHYKFLTMNSAKPLPFGSDTVDLIISNHHINHMTHEDGLALIKECYRIMKKGAVLRLSVPDTKIFMQHYMDGTLSELEELSVNTLAKDVPASKMWSDLVGGQKTAYDWDSLLHLGRLAGFEVERRHFNFGHSDIIRETMDFLQPVSIYVEMIKA